MGGRRWEIKKAGMIYFSPFIYFLLTYTFFKTVSTIAATTEDDVNRMEDPGQGEEEDELAPLPTLPVLKKKSHVQKRRQLRNDGESLSRCKTLSKLLTSCEIFD